MANAGGKPPAFLFSAADIGGLCSAMPSAVREHVVQEAQKILEQRFEFRGLPEVKMGAPLDWQFTPEGNVSWFWDLNRHRYFVTLGLAGHITGDAGFHIKLATLWDDWIARNPAGQGNNWRWPFEVAARLSNWLWAYFLLQAAPRNVSLDHYLGSMRDHAHFLADHLEYHWPNNHLLLESKALYEFYLLFPHLDPSGDGVEHAGRVLQQQILTQVLPDGVHAELCSMYHEIVAGELLELMCLCRKLHKPLPSLIEARIAKMRRFTQAIRRSDGSVPLLGDSSTSDTYLRFPETGLAGSEMRCCLGLAENASANEPGSPLEIFSDAGYAVFRDEEAGFQAVFDAGPFSRCATANHAHCDALSFDLFWRRPLLMDAGFYHAWHADEKWSQHFRSTSAHNTLMIDGREQSDLSELWDVTATAKTRMLRRSTDGAQAMVCAETTPHWGDNAGPRHQREISWSGREAVVLDRLLGDGRHQVQWFFHLAPGLEAEHKGAHRWLAWWDHGKFTCTMKSNVDLDIRFECGQRDPLQGWIAQSASVVVPAPVVVITATVDFPQEIEFRFQLSERQG
jgi:uncharacterized heparinase superfamily protein